MTVAYYFDESVNQAICVGLRLRKVDIITAQEDGKRATDDREIIARATKLNRPLVTSDQDFFAIADLKLDRAEPFSGVIYVQCQIAVGYAVKTLELYAKAGTLQDFANQIICL